MTARVRRSSIPGAVGDNRDRIRVLESVYDTGVLRWPLDIDPYGEGLVVKTRSGGTITDVPVAERIMFQSGDDSNAGATGIAGYDNDGNWCGVFTGQFHVSEIPPGVGSYDIHGVGVVVGDPFGTASEFVVLGQGIFRAASIDGLYVHEYWANSYTINLVNTATLVVKDAGGNPIFQIDQDGALHGLTGQSLVFDL